MNIIIVRKFWQLEILNNFLWSYKNSLLYCYWQLVFVYLGYIHPADYARINNSDDWLRRFLIHHDLEMNSALNMLWETCEWRKENRVHGKKFFYQPLIRYSTLCFFSTVSYLSCINMTLYSELLQEKFSSGMNILLWYESE